VIAYLLEQVDAHKSVMIGDTVYDVKGANQFEIPTIGVSWGFGKNEDLMKEGAITIAHSPDELYRDIKRSCQ
jgi:phosphoglycolate phosphatase